MTTSQMLRTLIIALIAGVTLAALLLVGLPGQAGSINDTHALRALVRIDQLINGYTATQGQLPEYLYEMENTVPDSRDLWQITSGITYEPVGETRYKLCYAFDSEQSYAPGEPLAAWSHPAGFYCFERELEVPLAAKPEPTASPDDQ